MKMAEINDNRNAPPPKPFGAFWFFDLEADEEYNLVLPEERIRLRDNLEKKKFFDNPDWAYMRDWFSSPVFTMDMFNTFLAAMRFYNRILHAKKSGHEILE